MVAMWKWCGQSSGTDRWHIRKVRLDTGLSGIRAWRDGRTTTLCGGTERRVLALGYLPPRRENKDLRRQTSFQPVRRAGHRTKSRKRLVQLLRPGLGVSSEPSPSTSGPGPPSRGCSFVMIVHPLGPRLGRNAGSNRNERDDRIDENRVSGHQKKSIPPWGSFGRTSDS